MQNNLNAPWGTGPSSLGDVDYRGLISPTIDYNGPMALPLKGVYMAPIQDKLRWDPLTDSRKQQVAELRDIISFWKDLKNAGASETLIQSMEDTIGRYIAEIYYLDEKPLR